MGFGDIDVVNPEHVNFPAPEMLWMSHNYSYPIDMWSVGNIVAELFIQRPLSKYRFENTSKRMVFIMSLLGNPNFEDFLHMFGLPLTEDNQRAMMNAKDYPSFYPTLSFELEKAPTLVNHESFVDLMTRILCYNPSKRLTPEEAIKHHFFSDTLNVAHDKNL